MSLASDPAERRRLLGSTFFVSAAVLGFEVSLMRILLVASYHHFAFLVISIALLGFGASGTALVLVRSWLLRRHEQALLILILLTAVSMPIGCGFAQYLDVEARFVPGMLGEQLARWSLYWGLVGLPFLFGAGAIGLALMRAGKNVAGVYAANLLGSAAGSILITVLMYSVAPAWLPWLTATLCLLAGIGPARSAARSTNAWTWGSCALGMILLLLLAPVRVRQDPYKYGAYVERLVNQGQATRQHVAFSPRAKVEAYSGEVFHDLAFLSVGQSPPPLSVLLADGHSAGSVLDISTIADAGVVDQTLMSLAYAVAPAQPSVALLGESGGSAIWLAARHSARDIDVVQPAARIIETLRGPLHEMGGSVLDLVGVDVRVTELRHFLDHAPRQYDLIQLVSLESLTAGSGGVGGLGQNHLVTVEGFASGLKGLKDDGVLSMTRGIQAPPRDNLKLVATAIAALRKIGVDEPGDHIVIVRDYLAVSTLVRRAPWTPERVQEIRRICQRRQLTPVWFPGVKVAELNHPDALPPPPDGVGDWYYYGTRQLLSASAEQFIDNYAFDIRPPTDDRPFFLDFCKLETVDEFKRAYGDLWLAHTEIAFLFVLVAIVCIALCAALVIIAPLLLIREVRLAPAKGVVLVYFGSIGLAYLLLEMAFLSRLIHWIGDPVTAASLTIAGFLLFSGLGSMTVQRLRNLSVVSFRIIVGALIAVGVLGMLVASQLNVIVGSLPFVPRCAVAFVSLAPLAYLMGFPMPVALARLQSGVVLLIPWAWGVNGFASVLAAPVATAIGMTWGFSNAATAAVLLYIPPLLLIKKVPTRHAT